MEGESRAEEGRATDLWQGCKGRAWAWAWSALLALEGSPRWGGTQRGQEDSYCLPRAPSCLPPSSGVKRALVLPRLGTFPSTLHASYSTGSFQGEGM